MKQISDYLVRIDLGMALGHRMALGRSHRNSLAAQILSVAPVPRLPGSKLGSLKRD